MMVSPQHESQMHGRGVNLVIICLTLNFVAAMLVVSRLVARSKLQRKLFLSDFVIVASCVSNALAISTNWRLVVTTITRDCPVR